MKTYITFFILFNLMIFSTKTSATIHTVMVGNFYFNPSNISNVNIGDTVRWQWAGGTHTTTSSSIPSGAASWDSPMNSSTTTFDYITAIAGTYNYVCTPHAGMGQVGSFTVISAPAPLTVDASADNGSLCLGQSTWIRALPSGGTGSYTYSWVSTPPGFTSNQQNVQVMPTFTTNYSVTVMSGTQTASSSVQVGVTVPAVADAGSDTIVCDDVTQVPVNGSAFNYLSVTWTTTGDGTFTSPNTLTGFYTPGIMDRTSPFVDLILTATSNEPCTVTITDSARLIIDNCTGILGKKTTESTLSIFPNPSSGTFSVSGKTNSNGVILFYDITGKIILRDNLTTGLFNKTFSLNTSGMIEVKVLSEDGVQNGKLILINR